MDFSTRDRLPLSMEQYTDHREKMEEVHIQPGWRSSGRLRKSASHVLQRDSRVEGFLASIPCEVDGAERAPRELLCESSSNRAVTGPTPPSWLPVEAERGIEAGASYQKLLAALARAGREREWLAGRPAWLRKRGSRAPDPPRGGRGGLGRAWSSASAGAAPN